MGRVERGCDLADDPECAAQRQPALFDEHRLQVTAVDERHRDVEQAVLFACVEHRHDAGMVERRGQLGLAQEAVAEVGLAECRGQELERGRPPQPHLLRAIDDARPPTADRLDDAVAADLGVDAPIEHRHEL